MGEQDFVELFVAVLLLLSKVIFYWPKIITNDFEPVFGAVCTAFLVTTSGLEDFSSF